MPKSLQGKTALVTGSSRGIGRAIAEGLASKGAAVVVNYVGNHEAADEVVAAIAGKGGKAIAVQADISSVSDIHRLFDEAESEFGAIDIVVANVGVAVIKPLTEATEADFDHVFGTNAKGTFFVLQEAARRVRNGGRIIAVSTGGTKMFFTQTALYLGSKGAVEQFVRVLSRELGPRGITVNALSPGFTDTDLLPERDRAVAAGMSPFGRIGAPRDVADVAVFLASDEARWLTGENIQAGGGVA
ncbi:3-ketoacyl-ACP reductase [Mesorhizobium sp. LSJC268A00]|jgi:3-oxoacyl-[acyl-carrier protein] reductase|uniref:SDR family oxidoreductase n=1 Tax=unclassified Mesorhizobium TaxID=325217 RepID=UPI0003CE83E6|nr:MULTISPECIES: SDR family oxidoreductase [unclassified Mesorhizobium]ESX05382.1 3-ketoacyl-ACP reductase [Mesorhizobium sp. LSJC268A00]ESX89846.1 3-ketoacyl-ACP reductase [Mesorhizobium sp. LSHC412B00]ESX99341.1 3-ketoacyl-ACP reductase [Mesorhizobium sp. LNJC405B00]ESY19846.1 3-ketoacyl-ACP reductase [Mesorhizobium sp. LNJC395A00]ESY57842.1 3-ketoacyl-ACP reductase [Mesorhizobium sp. LNJC374B00]